jgi:hypothetical protein
MLWRRVHVLRPRTSTSGGQSGGGAKEVVMAFEAEERVVLDVEE